MRPLSGHGRYRKCTLRSERCIRYLVFFFSSRRRHTRLQGDWSSDVCSSDLKFESTLSSLEPSKDPAVLGKGQQVFLQMCAPCHRPDGGGLVGPNICDDYWIHEIGRASCRERV